MSGSAILLSSSMSDPSVRVMSSVGKYVETEDFVEVGVVGLCVEICGDVLLGVADDSVAESMVVGKEVEGSGAVVSVDLRVLGCGVEREVIASRVVDLRVEDSRAEGSSVADSAVVDSRVVDSGVVDLRVVVSRFIILRVVVSCEVLSREMT